MGQNTMFPLQNVFGPNVLNISNQQHNGTIFFWKIQVQMWFKNMLESLWDLNATQWGEHFLDSQNLNTTTLKRCGHTILKTHNHKFNDRKWFSKVKCEFKCKMYTLCLKDCLFTVRQLQDNWSDTSQMLISKCPFGVFKSPKNQWIFFKDPISALASDT